MYFAVLAQDMHLSRDLTWWADPDCHEVIKYPLRGSCRQTRGRASLQKHVAIFSSLPKGIVGGGAGRAGIGAPFPVLSPQQLVGTAEADECAELRSG